MIAEGKAEQGKSREERLEQRRNESCIGNYGRAEDGRARLTKVG